MPPLKVLLISDGRPGHFSLSDGIVAAIARLRPVDVHRLEVKRPRLVPARLLSTLTNRGVPPGVVLQRVFGVDASALPKTDLIVSSGGDTIAANIAAARVLGGVPNLFYGSLRRFKPDDFALVLNSYARYAAHPKYLVTLKPNKLDPGELAPSAPSPNYASGQPPRTAGLLLGGDTPTMTFGQANWQRIADFVRATHKSHGTRWMASNSRRTPDEVSDQFSALAAEPDSPISRYVDVRKTGSGTLREIFVASGAIAVTADSSSMLSEAIWVRCPVVALSPAHSSLPPDEQDYRTFLSDSGWTASLDLAELSPDSWLTNLARLTPLSANPLDLLAADLQRRLPEIFR
jgi:uncharacterized protein